MSMGGRLITSLGELSLVIQSNHTSKIFQCVRNSCRMKIGFISEQ